MLESTMSRISVSIWHRIAYTCTVAPASYQSTGLIVYIDKLYWMLFVNSTTSPESKFQRG